MAEELKPCPFCGCKAEISQSRLEIKGLGYVYHVECRLCSAKSGGFLDKQQAIKNWNRRTNNGNL